MIRAVSESAAHLDTYRDQLAAELSTAHTRDQAEQIIDRVLGAIENDEELETLLWRTNLQANMAGELFVREIEVPRKALALSDVRKLQDGDEPFLNLPFTAAIDQFIEKETLTPEAFEELEDAERFRAFRMKFEVAHQVTRTAKDHLNRLMSEGPSDPGAEPDVIMEFIDAVQADEAALGFTPNSPFYLETVYRTATGTSYGAGRYRGQTDEDVAEATGFWQYVTAGDSSVRNDHADLDGKIWRIGDSQAESVYPPNGYNCRCVMTVLDADEVDERQLNREVDTDSAITRGFSGNPAGTVEEEGS